MTWQAKVVDLLCEYKADRYAFDEAWQLALRRHPPAGWAAAPITGETFMQFFRRACDDAWHDRRPKLRYFDMSMSAIYEDDESDIAPTVHQAAVARGLTDAA